MNFFVKALLINRALNGRSERGKQNEAVIVGAAVGSRANLPIGGKLAVAKVVANRAYGHELYPGADSQLRGWALGQLRLRTRSAVRSLVDRTYPDAPDMLKRRLASRIEKLL